MNMCQETCCCFSVIPALLTGRGYGATKMADIPAHSTLVFTLELVKIER